MRFAPPFFGLCMICSSAIADEKGPWVHFGESAKEEPLLKIDPALFPKSLGYEFRANDFEKTPNRQLLAIVENASRLVEVRGRFIDGKETQEWIVIYREGSPVVAQMKKWRRSKIGIEGLSKILTLIPVDGTFTPEDEAHKKCLAELLAFSKAELEKAKKEADE